VARRGGPRRRDFGLSGEVSRFGGGRRLGILTGVRFVLAVPLCVLAPLARRRPAFRYPPDGPGIAL
jgi:hypothetical protein